MPHSAVYVSPNRDRELHLLFSGGTQIEKIQLPIEKCCSLSHFVVYCTGLERASYRLLPQYGDRLCPGGSSQECDGERCCRPVLPAFEVRMFCMQALQSLCFPPTRSGLQQRNRDTQRHRDIAAQRLAVQSIALLPIVAVIKGRAARPRLYCSCESRRHSSFEGKGCSYREVRLVEPPPPAMV